MGQGILGYGHIFEHDGEAWIEVARLPRPAEGGLGSYGNRIALYGDTALVRQSDHIYRYREVGGQWIHEQTLMRPPEVIGTGSFGTVGLTMHRDWVFIDAYRDSTFALQHGSVLVYRREADGTLEYVQRILPPDLEGAEVTSVHFGRGVHFDGRTLAIGAPLAKREHREQGVVYIYELDGDTWTLRQELVASLAETEARLGAAVSVDGDWLVAGHLQVRLNEAFAFRRGADGQWREVAVLRPSGGTAFPAQFGWNVVLHENWAVLGAHNEVPGGAAYAFDLDCILGTNPCPVDMDGDGQLTIFDYLAFQTAFGTGDLRADFDGDGELTIFDFLAFQTAFAEGCE